MYTQSSLLGNRLRDSESCIQECPWEQHVGRGRKRVEESKTGQREKLNCGSVTRGADADPIGNSRSKMDLRDGPIAGTGAGLLYPGIIKSSIRMRVCNLGQGSFLRLRVMSRVE